MIDMDTGIRKNATDRCINQNQQQSEHVEFLILSYHVKIFALQQNWNIK